MKARGGVLDLVRWSVGLAALVTLGSCASAPQRPMVQVTSPPPIARLPTAQPRRAAVREAIGGRVRDEAKLKEAVRMAVRRKATEWTGKKPVVEVALIRA